MNEASMLDSMLKLNQNIGDGLGVIGVPPAIISSIGYPGAGSLPTKSVISDMLMRSDEMKNA